jgi:hypothetical protein
MHQEQSAGNPLDIEEETSPLGRFGGTPPMAGSKQRIVKKAPPKMML